jgi:CRP-like cAMP-binding protein
MKNFDNIGLGENDLSGSQISGSEVDQVNEAFFNDSLSGSDDEKKDQFDTNLVVSQSGLKESQIISPRSDLTDSKPPTLKLSTIIKDQHVNLDQNTFEKSLLKSQIIKQINQSYIMATSDMETLEHLYEKIKIKVLKPGEVLFTMGLTATSIYMVYKGNLAYQGMNDEGLMVDRFLYETGDIIGETYLEPDSFCMGIISATERTNLNEGEIDQTVLFELPLKKLNEDYMDMLKKKMSVTLELMTNFNLTSNLEKEEQMILMNRIQMDTFKEDDLIIKEVSLKFIVQFGCLTNIGRCS